MQVINSIGITPLSTPRSTGITLKRFINSPSDTITWQLTPLRGKNFAMRRAALVLVNPF